MFVMNMRVMVTLGPCRNSLGLNFRLFESSSPGKSLGYTGYKRLCSKKRPKKKKKRTRNKLVSLNLKLIAVITSQGSFMLKPKFSFELISYSTTWKSFVGTCFWNITDAVKMILTEKLGSISVHIKFILFLLK